MVKLYAAPQPELLPAGGFRCRVWPPGTGHFGCRQL